MGWMWAAQAQTVATVSMSTTPNPSRVSAEVSLTATVTPAGAGGFVSFYDGTALLGSAPVVGGRASWRTTNLAVGARSLTAYHFGDSRYAAVRSTPVAHQVTTVAGRSFRVGARIEVPPGFSGVADVQVADINGDGLLDIVGIRPGELIVYLGRGDGTFQLGPESPRRLSQFSPPTTRLRLADFTLDGILDIAYNGPDGVNILPGLGGGRFEATPLVNRATSAVVSQVADANGDGRPDVSAATQNALSLLSGQSGGTVAPPQELVNLRNNRLFGHAWGDFDGDGRMDLMTVEGLFADFQNSSNGQLVARLSSQPEPVITRLLVPVRDLVVADLNGDGRADVAMIDRVNAVRVMLGRGNGQFDIAVYEPFPGRGPTQVRGLAVSDFNGDGVLDLVSTQNPFSFFTSDTRGGFGILYGDGKGGFTVEPGGPFAGVESDVVIPADFNRDGVVDLLVVTTFENPQLRVYLGVNPVALRTVPENAGAQATIAGTAFPFRVEVAVVDGLGNGISGIPVRFGGPPQNEPSALIQQFTNAEQAVRVTDNNGRAGVNVVANRIGGGPYDFTAEVAGLNRVRFSLINSPGRSGTAVAVTATPANATAGQAVTFTMTVTPGSATGRFVLQSGNRLLGAVAVGAGGTATYTTSELPEGANAVTVEYSGDPTFNRSVTTVVQQILPTANRGPAISVPGGVVNGASLREGLAGGTWMTIYGTGMAESTRLWGAADFRGNRLPTELDGVRVNVNGRAAYVYFISPTQVNVLTPKDETVGPVVVEVVNRQGTSNRVTVQKLRTAPALFTYGAQQGRYAIAQDAASFALLGPPGLLGAAVETTPARAGQIVTMYATGLGETDPAYVDGEIPSAAPLRRAPRVSLGGREAEVRFAGLIGPGLYQLNLVVPDGLSGEVRVVVETEGAASPGEVFLPVE